MRILFDNNVPEPLKRLLSGHQVETSRDRGWEGLRNGNLLDVAERNNYEVLLTADQSIRYQQNLSGRRIALLVLMDNAWPRIRERTADVQEALDGPQPGEYRELEI